MPNGLFGSPQSMNNLGLFVNTYQIARQFTAEEIRTLNSVPITLVPAYGPNTVIIPFSAVATFGATDPPVAFSGDVHPRYNVGTTAIASSLQTDGTASQAKWDDDLNVFGSFATIDFIDADMPNA